MPNPSHPSDWLWLSPDTIASTESTKMIEKLKKELLEAGKKPGGPLVICTRSEHASLTIATGYGIAQCLACKLVKRVSPDLTPKFAKLALKGRRKPTPMSAFANTAQPPPPAQEAAADFIPEEDDQMVGVDDGQEDDEEPPS